MATLGCCKTSKIKTSLIMWRSHLLSLNEQLKSSGHIFTPLIFGRFCFIWFSRGSHFAWLNIVGWGKKQVRSKLLIARSWSATKYLPFSQMLSNKKVLWSSKSMELVGWNIARNVLWRNVQWLFVILPPTCPCPLIYDVIRVNLWTGCLSQECSFTLSS